MFRLRSQVIAAVGAGSVTGVLRGVLRGRTERPEPARVVFSRQSWLQKIGEEIGEEP